MTWICSQSCLIDETVDGYLRVVYTCDVIAIWDEIQWGLLGPLAALSWLCFQPSSRAFVGLGAGSQLSLGVQRLHWSFQF